MENYLVRIVTEIHIIEYHITLQFLVVGNACVLVIVLPGPHSCTLFALLDCTAILDCIYKGNISIINLRCLIEKSEYSLTTCKSHDDTVKLHAHLIDRHVKALVEGEEACKTSKCKAADSAECKRTSGYCYDNEADVTNLGIDRS